MRQCNEHMNTINRLIDIDENVNEHMNKIDR